MRVRHPMQAVLSDAFYVMLPFQLWGTFFSYPSVTSVAFQVFDCESFGDGTSCEYFFHARSSRSHST